MTVTTTLKTDAKNRAVRTLVQGLAFTVASTLVMGLIAALSTSSSWDELWGKLVAYSFAQTIGLSGLAYLMRAYFDRSAIPTPLPPGDPGEPDADAPGANPL